MTRKLLALAVALVVLLPAGALGSCGIHGGPAEGLAALSEPPGHYDRPAVVRGAARAGTYVGLAVGIVPCLVLWPVTKGLTAVVDEPLGYSPAEWNLLPASVFAAAGHYAFGLPAEALHWVFYGAWVERPAAVGFDHIPGQPVSPVSPVSPEPERRR